MKLNFWIDQKISQLKENYKEVEFQSAKDVELVLNGVSQNFLANDTPMDSEVIEIDLHTIPKNEKYQGSEILFNVKRPRKRKFDSHSVYVRICD
ncbi:hypothetical protein [Bacillus safensis]|uniref:hypothetical protein n=1 Tax=Bacillus safensis TaxID=561879 RepID=UPI00090ACCB9|nr:hypothetical protein [Bacillus safensis]APJ11098.1 hypothetical protein BSL056_09060 [Bacillus safensis]